MIYNIPRISIYAELVVKRTSTPASMVSIPVPPTTIVDEIIKGLFANVHRTLPKIDPLGGLARSIPTDGKESHNPIYCENSGRSNTAELDHVDFVGVEV